MQKTRLTPTNDIQLQHWIDKLKSAEVEYDIQTSLGKAILVLNKDDAEKVLGVAPPSPPPPTANPKRAKINKTILIVFGILVAVLFIPPVLISVFSEPEPVKELKDMTHEELKVYYDKTFGLVSDWNFEYRDHIKRNYANYPRTFKMEGVRVFAIDQDSFTHVFLYSCENAFGVRSDHSITSVVNVNGDIQRVVSNQ